MPSGEFVVMKSDLNEEYPPIWRIDGKTLLQKYEPFDQNGKTLYRNISTYSGWTPQNRHIYQQVPVKFRVQNRLETIVEFMRTEMPVEDQEMIEKSMKETAKYQDNFEVYIQTLISQALDSNFLTEIFQEQDDYFLSNVKCVDEITEERKGRLLRVAQWKPSLSNSVGTWPCFNFITDLPADEKTGKLCVACDKAPVAVRVQMYGQPYNSTTLEGCQPDPKVASQKDFLVCAVCAGRVKLYNKVAHQKYLMYIECAKRVADKRLSDPKKDTTVILNELLADEAWLNQLFKTVRTSWAEIDKLEHQAKQTVPSRILMLKDSSSPTECRHFNLSAVGLVHTSSVAWALFFLCHNGKPCDSNSARYSTTPSPSFFLSVQCHSGRACYIDGASHPILTAPFILTVPFVVARMTSDHKRPRLALLAPTTDYKSR
uniref:DUF4211 domain-containing protein n=1 Tax=Timema shepardi TaxID=629360 RepID=A0A7R9AYY1_TIMSH|nr:unnamed protein product [Timema shepardi]